MSKKAISIKIETGNAAFGETDEERNIELSRILRDLARKVEAGDFNGYIFLKDINGNTVGQFAE